MEEAHRCGLVICDLGLPDRSGADLMRDLKDRYGMRGLAVSGHTDPQAVRDIEKAGFDAHLDKPVVFDDLLAAVRDLTR